VSLTNKLKDEKTASGMVKEGRENINKQKKIE
jgi:hypothetical protein